MPEFKVLADDPCYNTLFERRRFVSPSPLPAYFGPWSTISSGLVITRRSLRSRTSTSTPNFKKLKDLPVQPYEAQVSEVQHVYGDFKGYQAAGGYNYYEHELTGIPPVSSVLLGDAPLTSVDVGKLIDLNAVKIRTKIKNQSMNLALTFAERKKTADMIATSIGRIYRAYRFAKKLDWVRAANELGVQPPKSLFTARGLNKQWDSVATGWLELQYGWKPTISDIYGGMEAYIKSRSTPGNFEKALAVNTDSDEIVSSISGCTPESFKLRRRKVTVRSYVYFSIDNGFSSTMAQLGLTNPNALAWELIPFSFVADWFINIGDMLYADDATIGLKFHKGGYTIYTEDLVTVDFETTGTGMTGASSIKWRGKGSGSNKQINIERVVYSDFPVNGGLRFTNPFSASHVMSAASLFQKLFRK